MGLPLFLVCILLAAMTLTEAREECPYILKGKVESHKDLMFDIAYTLIRTQYQSKFDFDESSPSNQIQRLRELRALSITDRKKTAEYLYWAMLTVCREESIGCNLCDLPFIAAELASGDQKCYFICSLDQSIENSDNYPTSKAFEAFVHTGIVLKKRVKSIRQLKEYMQRGWDLARNSDSKRKTIVPGAMTAALAIIKIATQQATLWEMKSPSKFRQLAGPLKRGSAGCFHASSNVKVLMGSTTIVKQLKDVQVGDSVESVDEFTGKKTFSTVYYIAHDDAETQAQLLNIYYGKDGSKSLGLSARHLLYASKDDQSAPLDNPVRADTVQKGDFVWVYESERLTPKKVVDIIPFVGGVRHPLTENHHIVVDGVHASVHVLNENLYRGMTAPLRFTYWLNPEWNKGGLVNKLVRFVESVKEPMFNANILPNFNQFSVTASM